MAPMSVLVVDDEIDSANTLAALLDLHGFSSIACYSATDGLVAADRVRPQAAVIDLAMPGVTGLDMARRIRATPWGARMPLIAISGFGRQCDHDAAREAGFDHLLVKPAHIERVIEALTVRTSTGN